MRFRCLYVALFPSFAVRRIVLSNFFFFFNDTATTEIYTLSLHDALPISSFRPWWEKDGITLGMGMTEKQGGTDVRANTTTATPAGDGYSITGHKWFMSAPIDRKSTRLNSSHDQISYAVFCLKKKKKQNKN